jgi:hypothetical protein
MTYMISPPTFVKFRYVFEVFVVDFLFFAISQTPKEGILDSLDAGYFVEFATSNQKFCLDIFVFLCIFFHYES